MYLWLEGPVYVPVPIVLALALSLLGASPLQHDVWKLLCQDQIQSSEARLQTVPGRLEICHRVVGF